MPFGNCCAGQHIYELATRHLGRITPIVLVRPRGVSSSYVDGGQNVARRRVVTLVAAGLLAVATALLAIAGSVSAHNPSASLTCNVDHQPELIISLTNYSSVTGHIDANTVSASIDGVSVLSTTNFGTTYSNTFSAGSPFVSHTAQVVVFAWDDPTGSHGWTTTINLKSD